MLRPETRTIPVHRRANLSACPSTIRRSESSGKGHRCAAASPAWRAGGVCDVPGWSGWRRKAEGVRSGRVRDRRCRPSGISDDVAHRRRRPASSAVGLGSDLARALVRLRPARPGLFRPRLGRRLLALQDGLLGRRQARLGDRSGPARAAGRTGSMIGETRSRRPLVADSTHATTASRSALRRRYARCAFGECSNQSRIRSVCEVSFAIFVTRQANRAGNRLLRHGGDAFATSGSLSIP